MLHVESVLGKQQLHSQEFGSREGHPESSTGGESEDERNQDEYSENKYFHSLSATIRSHVATNSAAADIDWTPG